MKHYKAKVIHNVEITLPDNSEFDSEYWLKLIASNIAYHGHNEHGRKVSEEIEIEEQVCAS